MRLSNIKICDLQKKRCESKTLQQSQGMGGKTLHILRATLVLQNGIRSVTFKNCHNYQHLFSRHSIASRETRAPTHTAVIRACTPGHGAARPCWRGAVIRTVIELSARLHSFSSRHSAVARIAAASSPSTNRLYTVTSNKAVIAFCNVEIPLNILSGRI